MNQTSADKERNKAKEASFHLLKIRLRSEHELREKLKLKKFSKSIINETIQFLLDKRFLDDTIFAKSWTRSRLNKPYGLIRIRFELIQKGIDKIIIEKILNQTGEDYNEQTAIRELAQKRIQKYSNLEPAKQKQRLYGYLARRGFTSGNIWKVINTL